MEASLQNHRHCSVLRVAGDLRLWNDRGPEQTILNLLPANMALPGNRLVLVLSGLTQIDSLGISSLVRVVIACVKNKVELCTVLPGGLAGQSIRSTRIFAAWPEFPSEEAALNQLSQPAAS